MAYAVPDPAFVTSESELFMPPLSPNAENDEFDSTIISGWSRNYTPSASAIDPLAAFAAGDPREDVNAFRLSWYRLQPAGPGTPAGPILGLHKQFAGGGALPNGLYLVRTKWEYRFGGIVEDDGFAALRLTASSGGLPDTTNQIQCGANETDGGLIAPQANLTVAGVNTIVQMPDQENTGDHFEYAAIIRNGTTFSCFAGNGVSWVFLAAFTTVLTIDRVFLSVSNNAATPPGNMINGYDFFRYFPQQDLP